LLSYVPISVQFPINSSKTRELMLYTRLKKIGILLTLCFCGFQTTQAQLANNDVIVIDTNTESILIDVLANDSEYCSNSNINIEISNDPNFGQAITNVGGTIEYIPSNNWSFGVSMDMLTYEVLENGEVLSTAYVFLMGEENIEGEDGQDDESGDYSDWVTGEGSALDTEMDMCEMLTCVWPGDTDHDGLVNVWDLLSVGVGYDIDGPPRLENDTEFSAQYALDWVFTQNNGTNYKHIDCNGDGAVTIEDVAVIGQNYVTLEGKTDDETEVETVASEITLSVTILNESIGAGDTINATIALDGPEDLIQNVYGLAFNLTYNKAFVDASTMNIKYNDSFLGEDDELLYLFKDLDGKVESAAVRKNHTGVNGDGIACSASFVMEDVLAGKTDDVSLELNFEKVTLIRNDGSEIIINTTGDAKDVVFSSIKQPILSTEHLNLYPNPAKDHINIELFDVQAESYELINSVGTIVKIGQNPLNTNNINLNVNDLPTGIYLLRIQAETGILQKRIVIVR